MEQFMSYLSPILQSVGTIITIIIGAFLVYGVKLLCKKLGLNITESDYDEIINIVKQVIKYLDQKYVSAIKTNSENGTLTEYQQKLIKEKATSIIIKLLTSEQVDFLMEKYKLDDLNDIIDLLIESNIAEARKETGNNTGIVVDTLLDDNGVLNEIPNDEIKEIAVPTEEELASNKICGGDCKVCALDCTYRIGDK